MTNKSIYAYTDYQSYLMDQLNLGGTRSGQKTKAAKAAGVHTTYLSQVLNQKAHLALEQADALAEFLNLTQDETNFLMLLVLKDRAGTLKLKRRFEKQIQEHLTKRTTIKNRIPSSSEITERDQIKFYSSVIYAAIHVLVSIPIYQKKVALADALKISTRALDPYLEDLLEMGVIVEKNGLLKPGLTHVHLDKSSPLINKHHAGWRVQTLGKLDQANENHTHYSAAFSLSTKDAEKIRENLLSQLKENLSLVKDSSEETAYVYCFDFFPLVENR